MKKSKAKLITSWILQVLLGLQFILAGQAKFTTSGTWETQFSRWGYPDNFYMVIGALEIIGAILMFIPKFVTKAAIGLGIIMMGATATHLIHREWDGVTVTLIDILVLTTVFLLRRSFPKQVDS
ncbi:MAG: DoxX family protein [Bacteroidota bacterium]